MFVQTVHPRLNTILDHVKTANRLLECLVIDAQTNGAQRRWINALKNSSAALIDAQRQIDNIDVALSRNTPPALLKDP